MKNQWFGKYRAKVVNINDPKRQGRIKVSCPRVFYNAVSSWCLPCIPNALDETGDYFIPKVGEYVWIEFEEGDCSKPIWTGGWYSENKIPISSNESVDQTRVISYNGNKVEMSKNNIKVTVQGESITLDKDTITRLNYLIKKCYSFETH